MVFASFLCYAPTYMYKTRHDRAPAYMYKTRHDDNAYVQNASRCCDFSGSGPPDASISGSGPLDVSISSPPDFWISLALVRQMFRFLWLRSGRCFDFSRWLWSAKCFDLRLWSARCFDFPGSSPLDFWISLALVRQIFRFPWPWSALDGAISLALVRQMFRSVAEVR